MWDPGSVTILTGYLVSDISFSTFHLLFNVDLIITDMY